MFVCDLDEVRTLRVPCSWFLTQQREGLSGLLKVLRVVHALDEDVLS